MRDTIRDTGKLEEETENKLRQAVEDFKAGFADRVGTVETVAAEEGVPDVSGTPAAEAGDAAGGGSGAGERSATRSGDEQAQAKDIA